MPEAEHIHCFKEVEIDQMSTKVSEMHTAMMGSFAEGPGILEIIRTLEARVVDLLPIKKIVLGNGEEGLVQNMRHVLTSVQEQEARIIELINDNDTKNLERDKERKWILRVALVVAALLFANLVGVDSKTLMSLAAHLVKF